MQIDERTRDHATLEHIRLMVIRRVRAGEDPGTVIASYVFNRTTIYKWMRRPAGCGKGLWALSSTPGTPQSSGALIGPDGTTDRLDPIDRTAR